MKSGSRLGKMKRCFKTELQDGAVRSNQKENQRTNERTMEWTNRLSYRIARSEHKSRDVCAAGHPTKRCSLCPESRAEGPWPPRGAQRVGKRRESEKVLIINYHLIYACVWWCYPSCCCSCSFSLDSKMERERGGEEGQGAVRLEHLRLAPSVVELSLSIVPLSTTMFRCGVSLSV